MGVSKKEKHDVSTQFLQTQKYQLIELQDYLVIFCNVLPIFGLKNAKYDINSKLSHLRPFFVNERGIESKIIKKVNQFVSNKFGDVKWEDVSNFFVGATSIESFLKAYKTSLTKCFSTHEWFNDPEKLNISQLPPYETFFSKLRNRNLFGKDCSNFQNLIVGGMTSEEVLS